MAAITGCTSDQLVPNPSVKWIHIITPATADSNDTIDVSSATVTGGQVLATIWYVLASDVTTGDVVTCTWSTTTITLDAAGGTTDHVYHVFVMGV